MKRITFALTALSVFVFFIHSIHAAERTPVKGESFPGITLQKPENTSELDYLALKGKGPFQLSQVKADLLIIEIYSMYCPYCQKEAPIEEDGTASVATKAPSNANPPAEAPAPKAPSKAVSSSPTLKAPAHGKGSLKPGKPAAPTAAPHPLAPHLRPATAPPERQALERELKKTKARLLELEKRVTEKEQAVKALEAQMAAPGFYDDRERASKAAEDHQKLIWETGDLIAQWEALQAEVDAKSQQLAAAAPALRR